MSRKLQIPAEYQQLGDDIAWALTKLACARPDEYGEGITYTDGTKVCCETAKSYRRRFRGVRCTRVEFPELIPVRSRALFRHLFQPCAAWANLQNACPACGRGKSS